MDGEKVDRLAGLKAWQIAGIAMAGSTVAAIATLYGLQRLGLVRGWSRTIARRSERVEAQPAEGDATAPRHFSEDAVIPGLTHTGAEILAEDERHGRSAEGV